MEVRWGQLVRQRGRVRWNDITRVGGGERWRDGEMEEERERAQICSRALTFSRPSGDNNNLTATPPCTPLMVCAFLLNAGSQVRKPLVFN